MARRRKSGLSPEDRAIWSRVMRSTRPLGDKARQDALMPEGSAAPPKAPAPPAEPAPPPRPAIPAFRIGERAAQAAPGARPPPPPIRMDHATHGKMIRGRLKPEARIDLHGMTLAEAHPELIRFITSAHARGARLVLVITGKGRGRDAEGPVPAQRGILRRQVPNWLTGPPLGALILDIREAHQRHGGAGALYVYLRRPR